MLQGMVRRMDHRNSHSLDESEKRELSLHVCILWECGITPVESVHLRLAAELAIARLCHFSNFDNFLNVKCPDDGVLKTVLCTIWWRKPTGVVNETDPLIAEVTQKDEMAHQVVSVQPSNLSQNNEAKEKESEVITKHDAIMEKRYKGDCEKITEAIVPLEQIQLEFVLMLLDNTDGTRMVPSTRKIFLDKFRRFVMDNCILDMRLFNLWRNSPSTNWCCHARLPTAVLTLHHENPSASKVAMQIPSRSYVDGELDFYNVDRLGGVLPFLVRTLRNDLVKVLGENNAFIESFEPNYNRSGGVDAGVSEMTAGSPGLASLPRVISSMARFMQQTIPNMPNGTTGEAAMAMKGSRSRMPGAGGVDDRMSHLRLIDALLALYHGAAVKLRKSVCCLQLCELRDTQADMADCLYDIDTRIRTVTAELDEGAKDDPKENNSGKKQMMAMILAELERSKTVYEAGFGNQSQTLFFTELPTLLLGAPFLSMATLRLIDCFFFCNSPRAKGEGGEKSIMGRSCARAHGYLAIRGHEKFAVQTETSKGTPGGARSAPD
ncbi:E3 ubiquitin-protein ligase RNF123 [Eumeta japonica]|uniref:E3 ubiquitin-protein ligase RNF123 n=1 Tax=Eumeta variegata TaxID=151549 RepID=A0A4C1VDU8_EUMVA|nr:E3 ubiquitin-protein ligase RNF123 [Eumeta japonica]